MEANLAKHRARAPRARGAGHAAVRRACAPWAIVGMAAFAAMASAQPVAVVTDVTGAVASSAGGPIAILASVSAGERLRLAPASRVALLYYGDGAQYDARGAGEVVVEASKPRAESGAFVEPRRDSATPAVRLRTADVAQGAIVMRNLGLRVVAPEAQVYSLRPELAWTDSRTEATYEVALLDATGRPVYETTTRERSAALPDHVALVPGASYALQVTARVRAAVAQVARAEFRIAPADLRERADALAPGRPAAAIADRVAYALWLEQNELPDEARRWWRDLARVRPHDDALRRRAGGR